VDDGRRRSVVAYGRPPVERSSEAGRGDGEDVGEEGEIERRRSARALTAIAAGSGAAPSAELVVVTSARPLVPARAGWL
jgi:hypothetical protein